MKIKKTFCKCCLQCFSSKKILIEHKKNCLIINGKPGIKLKGGSIEFQNHFKQLAVPFKIYADFESLLKRVKSSEKKMLHTVKNIKIIFLAVLLTKLFVLIISLVEVVIYRRENAVYRFIKAILDKMNYCKNLNY